MRGCLLASAALLCSGTAFAQEATPQANDQTGSATEALAEDIVVTATKKGYGESVQKVPMAVTAFGEAQLDAKFVQNLQQVAAAQGVCCPYWWQVQSAPAAACPGWLGGAAS